MIKNTAFLLVAISLVLSSCNTDLESSSKTVLDALSGKWEFTGTQLIEEWETLSPGHYKGTVLFYFNEAPEHQQYIDIAVEGQDVIYRGTLVGDESPAHPILFKMTEASKTHLLFENQNQDFPKHIRYDLINADKFRVTISGQQEDQFRDQAFVYYRLTEEDPRYNLPTGPNTRIK